MKSIYTTKERKNVLKMNKEVYRDAAAKKELSREK